MKQTKYCFSECFAEGVPSSARSGLVSQKADRKTVPACALFFDILFTAKLHFRPGKASSLHRTVMRAALLCWKVEVAANSSGDVSRPLGPPSSLTMLAGPKGRHLL